MSCPLLVYFVSCLLDMLIYPVLLRPGVLGSFVDYFRCVFDRSSSGLIRLMTDRAMNSSVLAVVSVPVGGARLVCLWSMLGGA